MKEQLRKQMLAAREAHHSSGGHVQCIGIMDSLLHMKEFTDASCVLLYAAKGSEVHTEGIIKSALSLGKRVALPVTKKEEKKLLLYSIDSVEELKVGAFGILEPVQREDKLVNPSEVQLVVVPGLCFDKRGHRLGYGMGYYDSLLRGMRCSKVGLAYSFQMVERLPEEPHDIAVDAVVTEKEVIECRKGGRGGEAEAGHKTKMRNSGGKRQPFRVAVLCSGRGTDFQSIIDGVAQGKVGAQLVGMITDNPSAGAIERAKNASVPVFVMPLKGEELDRAIKKKLDELEPNLVVLAGYMKIIRSKELLSAYKGRIINIHPSLLPAYPGAHAQRDAFEAGEKVSGYTIHFVDESLDSGPVIFQEKVDISSCKTWEEAASRILEREHVGLPEVVDSFAKGERPLGK